MPPSVSIALELVPGRFAQRVGQRLDAAGAGGRIGDEVDMALVGQDQLRVAGDAAGEARRAGHARCVCGRIEIESAPPTAAAKAAIVVRRMLVSGSCAVIMR